METTESKKVNKSTDPLDAENVGISLLGCCDYSETWEPGIKGWGATDAESRNSGYVSVEAYDELLRLYRSVVPLEETAGGHNEQTD